MDQEEFRQLAMTEMDAIYRMAYHLSRHPQEADDLVQETYLRAFKWFRSFRLTDHGIRPWLFKILHNVVNARYSQDHRERSLVEDVQHEPVTTEDANEPAVSDLSKLNWEEIDERLKAAIDGLALPYRAVFLLCAVEELRYREIAEVLEVPIGTVMSRLSRARATLAAGLADLAAERRIGGQPPRHESSGEPLDRIDPPSAE